VIKKNIDSFEDQYFQLKDKIDSWIQLHGFITAVFLQVKLKIQYHEAIKIMKWHQNLTKNPKNYKFKIEN